MEILGKNSLKKDTMDLAIELIGRIDKNILNYIVTTLCQNNDGFNYDFDEIT